MCSVLTITLKWNIFDRPSMINLGQNFGVKKEVFIFLLVNDFQNCQLAKDLMTSLEIKFSSYTTSVETDKNSSLEFIKNIHKFIKKNDRLYKKTIEDYLIEYIIDKEKNNIYKAYKHFHKIIYDHSADSSIINLLNFIERNSFHIYEEDEVCISNPNKFFKKFLALTSLNLRICNTLEIFQEIFKDDIVLHTAEKFYNASTSLMNVKGKLISILNDYEDNFSVVVKRGKNKLKDQNKRMALSVFKYDMIILRYVIEALTNTPLHGLPQLNIEIFDEFLSFNYMNATFMVLSTDPSLGDSPNFNIISISGINGQDKKFLSELFPYKYRREGNERLFKSLQKHKSQGITQFEYLIDVNGYNELFHYNYQICNSFKDDNLIVYGYYRAVNQKVMVIESDSKGNMNIVSYSKSLTQIFIVKPRLLDKIKHNQKTYLSINLLFKNVYFPKETTIECELNYKFLFDNFFSVIETLLKDDAELNSEYRKDFHEKALKLKMLLNSKRNGSTIAKLQKRFEINSNSSVYTFSLSSAKKKRESTHLLKSLNSLEKQSEISEEDEEEINFHNFMRLNSSSSMSGQGISEKNSTFSNKKNAIESVIKKNVIQKESKELSFKSSLLLFLNITMILLCISFLVIEIVQTKELTGINTIDFNFKTVRRLFNNVYQSYISLGCTSEDINAPIDRRCENKFVKYLTEYQRKIGFQGFDLIELIWFQNRGKANYLRSLYSEFKKTLNKKRVYKKFLTVLDTEVIFYQLEQQPDNLVVHRTSLTFDVALQISLNRQIELGSVDTHSSYIHKIFPFIGIDNQIFDFSYCSSQNFENVQRVMFEAFSNFINFSNSFYLGEKIISKSFVESKEKILTTTIIFMAIFLLFNIGIFFLNIDTLKVSNILFKKLFTNFVFQIHHPEFSKFFTKKISILISLSKLFSKNPSKLIQKIASEKNEYMLLVSKDKMKKQTKSGENLFNEIEKAKKDYLESLKSNSYEMKLFYKDIIRPLYIKNGLAYSMYFLLILILDMLLLFRISSVYKIRDYTESNLDLELSMYSSISLLNLVHTFNSSEENVAASFNNNEFNGDIINNYIRKGLNLYKNILHNEKISGYKEQKEVFPVECDKIFKAANDEFFVSFYQEVLKVYDDDKYFEISEIFCKDFQLEKHQYFAYEDYFHRIQIVHNQFQTRTLEGIYGIFGEELFTLYLYLYFYIGPVKRNFDLSFLIPIIISKFNFYVDFVLIYLFINLLLEGFLFCFTKFFISKEIERVKNLFFLFAQCI